MLAALDVFVLTSRNEANPVSVLEAMAAGKPVVAPRVGSLEESVADGRSGFLTPPGDAAACAERVLALLGDRDAAVRMGAIGRQIVRGHWSLDRMVRGYEELILAVYRRKCRRAAPRPKTPADGASVGAR